MLIRFNVSNFLSFKEPTDFDLLSGDVRSKKNHVETTKGIDLLKFSLLYGPNGAGKSNLIRSIETFRQVVLDEKVSGIEKDRFKFNSNEKEPITFEYEFFSSDNKAYIYGISILSDTIRNEYLYNSGLNKGEDKLVFERNSTSNLESEIIIDKKYQKLKKDKDLIELLSTSLLESDELLLTKILDIKDRFSELRPILEDVYDSIVWEISIIHPTSKPVGLLYHLNVEDDFLSFSNELISKLDIGIKKLHIRSYDLEVFLGAEQKKLINQIIEDLKNAPFVRLNTDVIAVKETDDNGLDRYYIKQLLIEHKGSAGDILFELKEESDGSQRLIEYLSLLYEILNPDHKGIWFVDEIERSIHPHLLKEILKVLVDSEVITGQLVFTTHESNLMDLDMFRQDEIWLTEKDENGATHFNPLSDFKIRKDLDIRKGYLKGRFGAIPMLANLTDINWYKYASNSQEK